MAIVLPKQGDGFVLRFFTREDVEPLAEIEFDAEVKRFLALPEKERVVWVREFDPEASRCWAIDVHGALAGRGSILPRKRRGERDLAVVIGRHFWGQKLGRKVAAMLIQSAFEDYDTKTIVGEVHPENRASIALMREFKFRRCGVVDVPPENWQHGHIVYRMSRRVAGNRVGPT